MPKGRYDWKSIYEGFLCSGLSVQEYCQREKVPTPSFYKFTRPYQVAEVTVTDAKGSTKTSVKDIAFTPVIAAPDIMVSAEPLKLNVGKVSLDVKADTDETILSKVLKVLISLC